MVTFWHSLSIKDSLKEIDSSIEGLSDEEAERRFLHYRPNELVNKNKNVALKILFDQLTSKLQLILIAAALLSFFLKSYKDGIAIISIVLLFGIFGFVQDYKAEKSIAALKKLSVPKVKVYRSGKLKEISSIELVPGDILLLETGNIVPADCRIIESMNLKVSESSLTGESEPVDKNATKICRKETLLGDRVNQVFMGTVVSLGRAKAVVVETGMNTEIGKIASMIQNVKQTETPLQKKLDKVGKQIAIFGFVISIIIILLGLFRGESLFQLIVAGISVAVAVIPEGLPAVVTITLAIGAQRMLKKRALIRKLPAVETLGSVTIICSDKTGTLTQNKMTVISVDLINKKIDFEKDKSKKCALILGASTLCNDAEITNEGNFMGDPTEGALVLSANEIGLIKSELESSFPRVAEIPFDSDRKRMTTIHKIKSYSSLNYIGLNFKSKYVSFIKGSADGLILISDKILINGKETKLTPELKRRIIKSIEKMASEGKRVLGVAYKRIDIIPKNLDDIESNIVFVGLIGMIDPPRPEVKDAVKKCEEAGIRPIMITGDHPLTAKSIASYLGIGNGKILTGIDLDKLSVEKLKEKVGEISIFARVSPEHKLKIIQALQETGHVVAMTGDGVNDAPALKKADIGVSMGVTGTDVAKEASDMVLLDDNFSTIVNAIEEGRIVYDNIKKFVKFSIAGNIGKVIVMLFGPLIFITLPLLPLQLLWLNLLTDGLLGLGLGTEKIEKGVMKRQPVKKNEGVFNNYGLCSVILIGILISVISICIGAFYFYNNNPAWQTMIFLTLAFCQVWQVLAVRFERNTSFSSDSFSNKLLLVMVILVIILQFLSIFTPFLQTFLGTHPITLFDIIISFLLSSLVLFVIEIYKLLIKNNSSA